jgi:hypothetical protein
MPAPAIPANTALTTIREDLIFTSSRLRADATAKPLEKAIALLLKEWTSVYATQLSLWDAQAEAEALIAAADDNLDDFIPLFANTMRGLACGEKSATWSLFFKVAPYEIAAPVLGDELAAVKRWSQLLGKSKEAQLTAHKKHLDKLIAEAEAAVKAREDAALANEHFRTKGALAAFVLDIAKKRDGLAADLGALAAKSGTLPRNYASRFFRKRATKVSAEEKALKAAKKAEEKQKKAEAEAAVKAAQAKVKAAMAELKAMRKAT